MKRQLLLFTMTLAAMMLPQGAWAAEDLTGETVFSLSTTGTSFGTDNGDGTFTKDGVTFTVYSKGESNSYLHVGTGDSDPWTFKANASYIKITLPQALQAGDVVVVNGKYNSNSGSFRICDAIANNNSTGETNKNALGIAMGSSMADKSATIGADSKLIGLTSVFLGWSSGSYVGSIASIKIYKGTPDVLTTNKTWNMTSFNTLAATTFNLVNDQMLYGTGVKIENFTSGLTNTDDSSFSGNLLYLNKHTSDFDTANGNYLEFLLPANVSGSFTITWNPNCASSFSRSLTYKIGTSEAVQITNKNKKMLETGAIAFNTTAITPVYIYSSVKSGSGGALYIHSIEIAFTTPIVTLDTYGYATFASPLQLDLANMSATTAPTAYKAAVSGTKVNFTEVNEAVAANTGILLQGGAGETVTIPIAASGTDISATNAFKVNAAGTTFSAESGYYYFAMKKNQATLTFGTFAPGTLAIPANKAYLQVAESAFTGGARELSFSFGDDETTGVETMNRALGSAASLGEEPITVNQYYDLQGRRVAQPTRGLYIVNGKKVVVK